MNSFQKDAVAGVVSFGTMLTTATISYALPIPMFKELLVDHTKALVVWTVVALVGSYVAYRVRKWLG